MIMKRTDELITPSNITSLSLCYGTKLAYQNGLTKIHDPHVRCILCEIIQALHVLVNFLLFFAIKS